MPSAIQQVHQEFNHKGLTVLAVNIQENRQRVADWVRKHNVTAPVLLDPQGTVVRLYRVTGTPMVVLIGRRGEMIGRAFGTRPWMAEKGRGLFEALLSPQAR